MKIPYVSLFVITLIATLFIINACTPQHYSGAREPRASSVIRQEQVDILASSFRITVVEYRDSIGRTCVFGKVGEAVSVDCGHPLPPLQYEDLPEVSGK